MLQAPSHHRYGFLTFLGMVVPPRLWVWLSNVLRLRGVTLLHASVRRPPATFLGVVVPMLAQPARRPELRSITDLGTRGALPWFGG